MNTIVHFITLEISLRLCMDDVKLSRDNINSVDRGGEMVKMNWLQSTVKIYNHFLNFYSCHFKVTVAFRVGVMQL